VVGCNTGRDNTIISPSLLFLTIFASVMQLPNRGIGTLDGPNPPNGN
jgi:hypothetical protein